MIQLNSKTPKRSSPGAKVEAYPPMQGEPLNPEQLEDLASEIAAAHRISEERRGLDLLDRLEENQARLFFDYRILTEAAQAGEPLTPAAEWLIDNFHIVEEQLREVREDLPSSFYRELPKLASGDFAGVPRVYHLAVQLIAHTDNKLEPSTLEAFVEAYQKTAHLRMGELWAFPISLRLALIENLRRYAENIVEARADRAAADEVSEQFSAQKGDEFQIEALEYISTLFDHKKRPADLSPTFIAQFAARLFEGSRATAFALDRVEGYLRREGLTVEYLTHLEHTRQAAAQISVGNIITSMRLVSTLDWSEFFERTNLVDRVLRLDPSKFYETMDFKTRDRYRHAVERIAKKTGISEIIIAEQAIAFAEKAKDETVEKHTLKLRRSHVGYFLDTDKGSERLENHFGYKPDVRESAGRFLRRHPVLFYVSAIFLLTAGLAAAVTYAETVSGGFSVWFLVFIVLLAITPAGELAVTVVNWTVTILLKPRPLPKLDFSENGIPRSARTFVVFPTLLMNEKTIEEIFEKLEIYYLANRDRELFFGLLGDLKDFDQETKPEDERLREAARSRCAELNRKYVSEENKRPKFYFFSRRREWNAGENAFICPERKRGNLHEFNRLLRGAIDTNFDLTEKPDLGFLQTIRYVITLDADTQLPRGAARRLVGTIEHPLNRPYFDAEKRRVTVGYGILQPRIEISLPSAARSPFAAIFSAARGFDPYTTAVSDVYQDLFGEGSFVGKGLYDVDAFEAALDRRIPKNKLLSHDLFEGLYARVALVSDIVFYDDYPSSYLSFSRRAHRWTRGDWQIMRWLLPLVPNADGRTVRNRLPILARWKILENLRRSLVAVSILLWLLLAWTLLPLSPLVSTLFAFVALTAPLYLQIAAAPAEETSAGIGIVQRAKLKIINLLNDLKMSAAQIVLRFAFLVHEAVTMIDAILRVFYRKFVSRKHLLEWLTAAESDRSNRKDPAGYYGFMFASPLFAVIVFGSLILIAPDSLWYAAPFLISWVFAPAIAFRLSQRKIKRPQIEELASNEITWMRELARRTWRFFETFVGEKDHWLPPDNFQQDPFPLTAHRTSPTNIGLFLLSTLAARDFGYLGTLETIERLELTLSTLERLPRFRGHFYNWYNTETLEPLSPHYISTVDSGNLAGCLISLAEGCLELPNAPLFGERTKLGLLDTLAFLRIECEKLHGSDSAHLLQEIEAAEGVVGTDEPKTSAEWRSFFESLSAKSAKIDELLKSLREKQSLQSFEEIEFWRASFHNLIRNQLRDLDFLVLDALDSETALQAKIRRENFRARLESIADFCSRLVEETDFEFLYDDERKVLTIGYRPTEGVRDNSYYDLLASEARLASFIAITTGDVEERHWFRLGRGLTSANGKRALISWSGTMFEYLMPLLLMRDYENTLLSETCRAIVRRQIEYGAENGTAWGVSESAYNARDLQLNYQYGPFGVPGLGLKRGLSEDLVVSPYSSALALRVAPKAATANMLRLAHEGMLGRYGFFEAVDYTKDRLPPGESLARIESYMAHHQGMIFIALDNLLNEDVMVRRFHCAPAVETGELLLQERIPRLRSEAEKPRAAFVATTRPAGALVPPIPRRYASAEQFAPAICLLSNGSYSVMITTAGSGFSRLGNRALTRWREDAVRDNFGQYIYFRDTRSGAVWSSGIQPIAREPQEYEAVFTESKARFRRRDAGMLTETEIIVGAEDDGELRRVTLTNETGRTRSIEVTSYGEIVLTEQAADEAHPAFSNLFVETFYDEHRHTIFARRRPRSSEETEFWMAHTIAFSGQDTGAVEYETDRAKFIGRGRTIHHPAALASDQRLSGTSGEPLDPIFALRVVVRVDPGATAQLIFATTAAETHERVLESVDKYRQTEAFERAEKLAWTRSQVELRHLGVATDEANLFQRLAGDLVYTNSRMRPSGEILKLNRGTPQTLWKYGISGDLPIMIARINAGKDLERTVSQILRAHEYLRHKGLVFDLVLFNDQPTSYAAGIREDLLDLIRRSAAHSAIDQPGGVFIRRSDEMPEEDRIALHAAARVCFVAERGTLEEHFARQAKRGDMPPSFIPREAPRRYQTSVDEEETLEFRSRFGGFAADGSGEYVVHLDDDNDITPMPWSNVIANESGLGLIAGESGTGAVWSSNSRENRLTSWTNDPVCNQPSECVYLRDEATGSFWTATALPIRENSKYKVRYGAGYAIYQTTSHGLRQEILTFAAENANVKVSRLRVENLTDRRRELSASFFCDLVMGVERAANAPFIVTEIDKITGAIFARNPYNTEFARRVAFIAAGAANKTWTCDRREFIGRNGNLARPAALLRERLSGAVGAGFDPCAAIQTKFELAPKETGEIIFLLGEDESEEKARMTVSQFLRKASVETEFSNVKKKWSDTLGAIQVKTPDKKLDLLVNHWLVYQTLACRFWARSSVYQSSGAYGFRDQLQDAMTLVYARPDLAREHILRAASRQFKEGDVQHWWHEPSGAGTRTRISDNLLWLVLVSCFYAEKTGDAEIFDEQITFLDAPVLGENEQEIYLRPVVSNESATLFEHCRRAIERSLATGERGLPLIGAGDWSDGLNRVGEKGEGESVWLGFFFGKILNEFTEVCERRGENRLAAKYREHGESLRKHLEQNAWDGKWYLRAFFDDGTPLGSSEQDECKIDSLSQSWSVISGLGNANRSIEAIKSVENMLIKKDEKLALLLAPPFEKTKLEPGYIKGYPPGVRENGGQYTHAAAWLVIAYALMDNGNKAYELFSMLNPINHTSGEDEIKKYKTEPYAVAADIYADSQHAGRGGWTWYTGAAGWLYRAALEHILGFQKKGDRLKINPRTPTVWNEYEIKYRFKETFYRITIRNPQGGNGRSAQITLDGEILETDEFNLVNDHREHCVLVTFDKAKYHANLQVTVENRSAE